MKNPFKYFKKKQSPTIIKLGKKDKLIFKFDTDDSDKITKFRDELEKAYQSNKKFILIGGGVEVFKL